MSASTGIRTRSRHTNQLGLSKSKNNEKSGSKATAKLETPTTRSRLASRLMDVTNKENDSSIRQRPSRSRTRSAKGKPRDQSKTVENQKRLATRNSPKTKETTAALSSSEPLRLRNKSVSRLSGSYKQETELNSKENTAAIEPRFRPTRLKKPTFISKESWGSIPKKPEVVKKPESPKEPRQNDKKVSPQKSPSTAMKSTKSTKVLRSGVKKVAVEKPKQMPKHSAAIKSPEKAGFVITRSRRMPMAVLPKAKEKVQKPAKQTVNSSRKTVTRQKTFPEIAISGKRLETKTSDSDLKLQKMMSQIPADEIQLKDFSIVLENFDKSLLSIDESVAVEKSPEKTVSDVEIQPRNFSIVLEKLDLSTIESHEILREEKSPNQTVSFDENKSKNLGASKESKESPETPFEEPENESLKELSNKENLIEEDATTKKSLTIKQPVIQRLRARKMSVFVESKKSVKRPRSSTETELKPVAKKRVVIQSPVKEPIRNILPFRRLLEVQEEKEETEADSDDVYDFRMSQPVYPENTKRKKANPVKRLNNNKKKNNKKTNAGSKLENLIQQNALNFAVNSCVVMHNPAQFKKEKEKVQKSLKTGQKNNIPKVNLVESDIADLAKEIKLPQRKAPQPQNLSVNTTKTRTPPHTVQRRLNMNSPGPDLNNEEMEAILSENHLNLPKNPAITKIVEPTKRTSLVFSPKIVSSPKVIASPFRVNDEIKFPRTFYFSLTKDNMPSYSSDPLIENPDKGPENAVPANKTVEKYNEPEVLQREKPADDMPSYSSDPLIENLDKSPHEGQENPLETDKAIEKSKEPEILPSEKSADLFVTAAEIDESTINNSNMENIAPPSKIIPKSPEKFGILKNPTRSPLKALMIEGLFEERIPPRTPFLSPLAVYSSTGNPPKKNVVILSNETITKAGHQSNSQITEDFSDIALENRDLSAQQPDSISKTSAESRNLEQIDKKGVSSDASDIEDFGFDDLMDENNRDSETVDPQPRVSLEAIKEKLSSLKKYLPSKQKNTSGEKKDQSGETSSSLLAPLTSTKLFTSPSKRLQDIREMFTSTPNQAIAMKNRKKISFGGESVRPSSSFALEEPSETQNTVTEEASAVDENSEVPTQIELFDDPANTTDFSVSRDFISYLYWNFIIKFLLIPFRICTKATREKGNLHSWT